MATRKEDLLGSVDVGKASSRPLKVEKILSRNFEKPESVVYMYCARCGVHIELSEPFKKEVEDLIQGEITNERQYFQTEGCHGCGSVIPKIDTTIHEVSVN